MLSPLTRPPVLKRRRSILSNSSASDSGSESFIHSLRRRRALPIRAPRQDRASQEQLQDALDAVDGIQGDGGLPYASENAGRNEMSELPRFPPHADDVGESDHGGLPRARMMKNKELSSPISEPRANMLPSLDETLPLVGEEGQGQSGDDQRMLDRGEPQHYEADYEERQEESPSQEIDNQCIMHGGRQQYEPDIDEIPDFSAPVIPRGARDAWWYGHDGSPMVFRGQFEEHEQPTARRHTWEQLAERQRQSTTAASRMSESYVSNMRSQRLQELLALQEDEPDGGDWSATKRCGH